MAHHQIEKKAYLNDFSINIVVLLSQILTHKIEVSQATLVGRNSQYYRISVDSANFRRKIIPVIFLNSRNGYFSVEKWCCQTKGGSAESFYQVKEET